MSTVVSRIHPINTRASLKSTSKLISLHYLLGYIKEMVLKGGPEPSDYPMLHDTFETFVQFISSENPTSDQLELIQKAFGEAISPQTIQGFAFHKPHGYAGDYEIIEKIYQYYISPNPMLSNWDHFFHAQSAPQAVRNRVSYFLGQVWKVKTDYPQGAKILNLASGPGRDMYESLKVIGQSQVFFDCVDQDPDAIHYAQSLCRDFLSNITFIHRNVFRFVAQKSYDLIWSAGLFDYFNDVLFKRVLKRLLPWIAKNGKLVIGNFSEDNPSRAYMELFDWKLHHRSREKLRLLAEECGISPENISIEQEPEGINLFLHILHT